MFGTEGPQGSTARVFRRSLRLGAAPEDEGSMAWDSGTVECDLVSIEYIMPPTSAISHTHVMTTSTTLINPHDSIC